AFYVDLVATDEGHEWEDPLRFDALRSGGLSSVFVPSVLTLVQCFHALGFATPAAIEVLAQVWRPVEMSPDFHRRGLRDLNQQTLARLQEKGLLREASERAVSTVIERWLFPLHSADLSPVEVDQDLLRAVQNDHLYRNMGVENIYREMGVENEHYDTP